MFILLEALLRYAHKPPLILSICCAEQVVFSMFIRVYVVSTGVDESGSSIHVKNTSYKTKNNEPQEATKCHRPELSSYTPIHH